MNISVIVACIAMVIISVLVILFIEELWKQLLLLTMSLAIYVIGVWAGAENIGKKTIKFVLEEDYSLELVQDTILDTTYIIVNDAIYVHPDSLEEFIERDNL